MIFWGAYSGDINAKKRDFWFRQLPNHKFDSVVVVDYNGIELRCRKCTMQESEDFYRDPYPDRVKFNQLLYLFFRSPFLFLGLLVQVFQLLQSKKKRAIRQLLIECLISIRGLAQMIETVRSLNISKKDIVINWGENQTGQRLIAFFAHRSGAKLITSEYGELQRTVFVSESGMFHKAWPYKKAAMFSKLPVSVQDREKAKSYLHNLFGQKISNKTYTDSLTIKEKILSFNRPVVYVNGVELFASGLTPRILRSSHEYSPKFNSNRHLLKSVLKAAAANNWTVLYKDHPNTLAYYPLGVITDIKDDRLVILDNVDIYEVMDIADVTVTLGSKVSLLSLSCNVPVVLIGPYTMSEEQISWGLIESTDVEAAIIKALKRKGVDQEGFIDYTTRMLKYYLYELEESNTLFGRNNSNVWHNVEAYLAGESSVISTVLKTG